ncbi:helicase associated domain-containing protein [Streptomyces sp. NPDC058439]|uniref:helicase associated domain-containing protein n=1 Tax=Streptomyces sp. NPDC058439 TaxID=3346500 RepID=UPI00366730CE
MSVAACFAAVREMLVDESALAYVEPGVTVHGMDVGRWLERRRQHEVWQGLMDGQRERLEQLGVVPLPPEQEAPAKPSEGASGAFERGVVALGPQYKGACGLCDGPQGPRRAAGAVTAYRGRSAQLRRTFVGIGVAGDLAARSDGPESFFTAGRGSAPRAGL